MQDINAVHAKLEDIKKERRELSKMIKDELSQNEQYKQVVEEMDRLREKKKSIETTARAAVAKDAMQMDALTIEIKDQSQLLTDIALQLLMDNETVDIIDRNSTRWSPVFSVKFKKEKEGATTEPTPTEAKKELAMA